MSTHLRASRVNRRSLLVLATVLVALTGWLVGPTAPAHAVDCEYPAFGDINADGQPELAVGVPNADDGKGAVDIYYDRTMAPTRYTAASLGFTPGATAESFGSAVLIRDLDGDGCSELIVGAPSADNGAGRVYIAKGTPMGLATTPTWPVLRSPAPSASFGAALTSTYASNRQFVLMIGAPGYDEPEAESGAVYLVPTDETTGALSTPIAITQDAPGIAGASEEGDRFGSVVDDNVVGVPDEDVGTAVDAGSLVRLLIKSASPLSISGEAWNQNSPGVSGTAEAGDRFGAALSGVYYLLVGVPGEKVGSLVDAGMVHLFQQPDQAAAKGFRQLKSYTQDSAGVPGTTEAHDSFGAAVAVGDLESGESGWNLWIGSPGETINGVLHAGSVTRIAFGGSRLPTTSLYAGHGLPGTLQRQTIIGRTLGVVGDDYIMEEDGSTSLLIGAPYTDRDGKATAGMVFFSRYSFDGGPRTVVLPKEPVADEMFGWVFGG